MENNEIKFSKSQKNKPIIIYQNYIYNHEIHKDLTSYWCCENKKKGCPARIIMFNNNFQSSNNKRHNHLPNQIKNETIEFKNKLKRKVEDDPADSLKNSYDSVISKATLFY